MTSSPERSSLPTQQQFHQAISAGADSWYGACFRITRNEALAQDAVQDALLSAWSRREQFRGTSRLETWIHRIAINSALTLIRKQKPGIWTTFEHEPAADTPTPQQHYADQQMDAELSCALEQLSELERVCFVLKHLEEWRLSEIARQLNTGIGPVKQALFRALGKLRGGMSKLKGAP